jgi:DNA-3-methyladenine glycosylase
VLEVAPELIGCTVLHEGTAGVIVETEAYHQEEPACHAYIGLTARTSTLFGPPGVAYVYRSYGIHALLNAVCEAEGVGAAVLIRALRPVEGLELMRERRGMARSDAVGARATADRELCSGPGRLTQALGIELAENGTSLVTGPVVILPREEEAPEIIASPRVGITKAAELPWRFSAAGEENVSKPWPGRARSSRSG